VPPLLNETLLASEYLEAVIGKRAIGRPGGRKCSNAHRHHGLQLVPFLILDHVEMHRVPRQLHRPHRPLVSGGHTVEQRPRNCEPGPDAWPAIPPWKACADESPAVAVLEDALRCQESPRLPGRQVCSRFYPIPQRQLLSERHLRLHMPHHLLACRVLFQVRSAYKHIIFKDCALSIDMLLL
jgi:hypothetical protein